MLTRLNFIDILKGLAIFLVILGHAIQYTNPDYDSSLAFRLIYAVHMPLFMFLGGYVTKLEHPIGIDGLKKKWLQLIVPFCFWLPVSFLAVKFIQQPTPNLTTPEAFIWQVLQSPDAGGLWFLIVLFECHLLTAMLRPGLLRKPVLVTAMVVLVLNVLVMSAPSTNWLGLGLLRWYFLFFMAGVLVRYWRLAPLAPSTGAWLGLLFLLLAAMWLRKGAWPVDTWFPALSGARRQLMVQGYHLLTAGVGIAALWSLSARFQLITSEVFQSPWVSLGQKSLHLYAGHYIFLYLSVNLATAGHWPAWLAIPFVVSIALSGALSLATLLQRLPAVSRLAFGR